MIRLRSLGECVIEIGETRIGPQQEVLFAVLLVLALERGRAVDRRELVDLLWPSAALNHSRHRLRQALYRIRSFGVSMTFVSSAIELTPAEVTWDVETWLAATLEERIKSSNVGLGFLPQYHPEADYALAEFVDSHRRRVNARVRSQLAQDLQAARISQDWLIVEVLSRRLLQLDPLHEEGTLALAEATARYGSKQQALQLLDSYVSEVGSSATTLTLPAQALRRRISDYNPVTRGSRQRAYPVRLVGRASEQRALSTAILDARAGAGANILLCGSPGIGKSALAHEALTFAALCGAQTAQVAVRRADTRHPMSAIAHLASVLTDLPGALGCSPDSLRCLQTLAGKKATHLEGESSESASTQLPAVRRALIDMLESLTAEAALVILLDDIHWLDRFSRSVVEDIIQWSPHHRLVCLLTSRVQPDEVDYRLEQFDTAHVLRLQPLNSGDSHTLLAFATRAAQNPPPAKHLEWCVEIAQGNPLHLRALGAHWVDTGKQFALPPSLREILVSRLSLLTDVAGLVLQASALLGRHSSQVRLERMLELPAHRLCQALCELEQSGMLSSAQTIQPRHDLISEAILAGLTEKVRLLLHRRAALVLEEDLTSTGFPPLLWDIAHHWDAAGDGYRVLATAHRCADHLISLGLPGEAADILAAAHQYCQTLEQKLELCLAQSRTSHLAGRHDECLIHAKEARTLGLALHPSSSWHSDVELIEFEARWRQNEPIEGILCSARECLLDPLAPREHRLDAARWALIFADNMGADEYATELYYAALPLAATDLSDSCSWCSIEVIYHASFGDLDRAISAAEALVSRRRVQGSHLELSRSLRNVSAVYFAANREMEGEASLFEAFELGRRYRLAGSAWATAERLACRFLHIGNLEQAKAWAAVAAEWLGSTAGDDASREDLSALRARIALAEDNAHDAAELYDPILSAVIADKIEARRQTNLAYYIRLRLALNAEIEATTLACFEEIVRRRLGRIGQDGPVYALCLALSREGELHRVRSILHDYVDRHRRDRRPMPLPLASLACAEGRTVIMRIDYRRALLGMDH